MNFCAGEVTQSLRSKTNDDVIIACSKLLGMKNVTHTNLTQITATMMPMIKHKL